jgi:dynein heavy chain, axonemal
MVAELEADLKVSSVEVEKIKVVADAQAETVRVEKEIVDAEAAKANVEAEKCNVIAKQVDEKLTSVQKDLDMALPAVAKAEAALGCLQVKDFQTLKVLQKPPPDIEKTFTCVLNLFCTLPIDTVVPVDKKGRLNVPDNWKAALQLMKNPQGFLDNLMGFKDYIDQDKVPKQNFAAIRATLAEETFNKESLMVKSSCAGNLCDWVINITVYYDVVVSVEPKKQQVAEAQQQLAEANAKKEAMETMVAELSAKLAVLQADFDKAMKEKNDAEAEANRCAKRLDSANRLVNALGSEQERWVNAIARLEKELEYVAGDVLLASSFVSYVGPFSKEFREVIINENFIKYF